MFMRWITKVLWRTYIVIYVYVLYIIPNYIYTLSLGVYPMNQITCLLYLEFHSYKLPPQFTENLLHTFWPWNPERCNLIGSHT